MWEFVKLLLGRWVVRILLLLAIGSAVSRYIPGIVVPSWVPHGIFDVALIVASWDIYRKKQKEIVHLRETAIGRPELVIYPQDGSRYYVRADPANRSRIVGTFMHLDLIIANKGKEISIINRYDLKVDELGETYSDLRPRPVVQIQGNKTLWALGQGPWLMDGSLIRVEGGTTTDRGFLPLEVPGSPPDDVGSIHCKLTVFDDAGNTASCDLEVGRA